MLATLLEVDALPETFETVSLQGEDEAAGAPPSVFYKVIHRISDRLEPEMFEALLGMVEELRGRIDPATLEQAVRTGNVSQVIQAAGFSQGRASNLGGLADMEDPVERIREKFDRAFQGVGSAAAEELGEQLGVEIAFDSSRPNAARWARRNAADLVTDFGLRSRQGIRLAVEESFRQGITPQTISRMIRDDFVGLSARGSQAVTNFRGQLEELRRLQDQGLGDTAQANELKRKAIDRRHSGVTKQRLRKAFREGVDPDFIDDVVDTYSTSMLNFRTRNISRTEIARASSAGQNELWNQAIDDGFLPETTIRQWTVTPDDRLCPICAPMAGSQARMGEDFVSPGGGAAEFPPIHPSCRCAVVIAVEDTLDEAIGDRPGQDTRSGPQRPKDAFGELPEDVTPPQEAVDDLRDVARREEEVLATLDDEVSGLNKRRLELWERRSELAEDTEEFRQVQQELLEVQSRVTTLRSRLGKVKRGARQKRLNILSQPEDARTGVQMPSRFQFGKADVDQGKDAFSRMMNDRWMQNARVPIRATQKNRAFYDPTGGKDIFGAVKLPKGSRNSGTVIHEMGHALERNHPEVHRAAMEFWERRTSGEGLKRMGDVTGKTHFRPDEVTKPDGFFDAYVGKRYPGDRHSEVVSMGLEKMYDDPVDFWEQDSEHFSLIWRIMHGNLPGE